MTNDLLPLTSVANRLTAGGDGIRVTVASVRRWTKRGVMGASGRRVFLRTTRVGGRIYTRPDWLDEFLALCAGDHKKPTPRPHREESQWRSYLEKKHGHRNEKEQAMPDVRQPLQDAGTLHSVLPGGSQSDGERQGNGQRISK